LKHNTVQPNQTNHPQITVHTSKRRQAGRVNINRAGRYRGSKRRLVGVTVQVQQVASSVVQRVRQRDGQGHKPGIRTGMVRQARDQSRVSRESDRNREQEQDTGPKRTQHQSRVCKSGH
ncbi:unnamed protein product, partial [Staurois parvus]